MSKVRLCAEILSTGKRCRQFALKGQSWCYSHADPRQRLRNADGRDLIATVSGMDLLDLTLTLYNTVYELRRKIIPPLHAYALFDAAADRLNRLIEEEQPPIVPPPDSHSSNRLDVAPMK